MTPKVLEIIASGLLVLVSALAGAWMQSFLQKKRETQKTLVELRNRAYTSLCEKMIPIYGADIQVTSPKPGRQHIDKWHFRVGDIANTNWHVVVSELHVAILCAELIASPRVAEILRRMRDSAASVLAIIEVGESEFEVADDETDIKQHFEGFKILFELLVRTYMRDDFKLV